MSPLARMALVRRLTPPVRPSRYSLAFLRSSAPRVCSTPVSAPSVRCHFLLVHNSVNFLSVQPHRHPRRSPRSGKRPATNAPRSSKSTPSQVRKLSSQLVGFFLVRDRIVRYLV